MFFYLFCALNSFISDVGCLLEIWVTSCWSKVNYPSKWSCSNLESLLAFMCFVYLIEYNYGRKIEAMQHDFICFQYRTMMPMTHLEVLLPCFSNVILCSILTDFCLILQVLLSTDLNALFVTSAFAIPSTLYFLLQVLFLTWFYSWCLSVLYI